MTQIVNIKHEKCEVFCGRGSIFGNPYVIGRDGTREHVINRYREWFAFLLKDATFVRELRKLKGKKLGCFCVPDNDCHVRIIKEWLDSNE